MPVLHTIAIPCVFPQNYPESQQPQPDLRWSFPHSSLVARIAPSMVEKPSSEGGCWEEMEQRG